jgi:hypothetical protein
MRRVLRPKLATRYPYACPTESLPSFPWTPMGHCPELPRGISFTTWGCWLNHALANPSSASYIGANLDKSGDLGPFWCGSVLRWGSGFGLPGLVFSAAGQARRRQSSLVRSPPPSLSRLRERKTHEFSDSCRHRRPRERERQICIRMKCISSKQ